MKDNYSIEEILNAVNEIKNIKNKKKEEKKFHNHNNNSVEAIPKDTLRIIEEAEQNKV